LDLFHLQIFVAVVEEGSFSRAAQRVHRTQPAVSQVIHKLEEQIGKPLLDRSSRDGSLTDAGQVLYEYALRLLNLKTEAETALSELHSLYRGVLTIAANEFTCLYLLPVLDEFRRLYPTIKISVHRSLASRIPESLLNRTVEMGVTSFQPNSPDLRAIRVYRDQLTFVVQSKHPLAGSSSVKIHQLGNEQFIAHIVASPYRVKVVEAFRKSKTPLNMTVELPTIESIKKFVEMGNGVALLPHMAVKDDLADGKLVAIPIPELQFERKLRIVYRKRSPLSNATQAFLKVAEGFAKRHGGRYLFQKEQ
jgi:DNA-binding transcriptional LysR family regulator